jgi:hypothetical protein
MRARLIETFWPGAVGNLPTLSRIRDPKDRGLSAELVPAYLKSVPVDPFSGLGLQYVHSAVNYSIASARTDKTTAVTGARWRSIAHAPTP